MPRKQVYCARGAAHPPPCKSPEAMARQRQRDADRRPSRVITPEARSRWNKTQRFARFGITPEQFAQTVEDQDYACGICGEPFGEDQRICIDHDHACCPVPPSGHARSCGKCVRGLLCVRCNTWLGWLELYGGAVSAYLAQVRSVSGEPDPSRPTVERMA